MPESPSEAQLIMPVERLERQVRMHAVKLYAERTGADFLTAQRVINGLGF